MANLLESQKFAERVANIYIKYPRIQRIYDVLSSMRCLGTFNNRNESQSNLFIIGQSGVGKTRMIKRYAEMNKGFVKIEDGIEYDIKPVVYLELPDPFTLLELYQSIIKALGAPIIMYRPSIGDAKRHAFTLLEKQQVEMLIFDEMDYILSSRYIKPQEAMEAIKHIGNVASTSLVCVGTPQVDELRKLNFQYFRRFPKIELERFNELNDEFCTFLNNIEKQINPIEEIGLGDMETNLPQVFFAMSKGVVSIITRTIQEAYRLLGVFNEDFDDISKAKLSIDFIYAAYKNIVGDINMEEFERAIYLK
ncbi:TniB family protein [Clostridium sp. DL-VIII]|uniref:TniB family NTP-binding protein n=1 Tax=Clostridium sp. DL-VIII TaxID=641107 RepID=UPI00023AF4E5|nr:TniB family NTP-binding protein [Clostridium sp. DL-VIII]EHI97273.1 TniB family protein [Clostridium sp. DL-VIII]